MKTYTSQEVDRIKRETRVAEARACLDAIRKELNGIACADCLGPATMACETALGRRIDA